MTVGSLAFSRRLLAESPRGDGRPIMLLPGLGNSDRSMFVLKRYLRSLGYEVEGWGLGRNFGLRTVGKDAERLSNALSALFEDAGEPITLIGVSLGGMLARLMSQRLPGQVREVISIASPYAGHPRANNVWRLYQWLSGEVLDSPEARNRLTELQARLPVPATAIWSRSDGLVNGRACFDASEPGLRAIHIPGSHMGVQLRPRVMRAVADVLAGES